MKNLLYTFILLVSLSSCEDLLTTTLNVDPPPHTPELSVHAYIADNDSIIYATVGRSYGILEDRSNIDFNLLDGANVSLMENGNVLYSEFDTLRLWNDFLYFVEVPSGFGGNGNNYEIQVTHPDYPTATATQTMPQQVPIISAVYKENAGFDIDGEPSNGVEIEFQDPPNEDNYYEVLLLRRDTFSGDLYTMYTSSSDFNVEMGASYETSILKDSNFDGRKYKLIMMSYDDLSSDIVVVLKSLTRDYYLYSKSVGDFRNGQDFGLFSEPVTISSNVENGLGVFGMRSESRMDVTY